MITYKTHTMNKDLNHFVIFGGAGYLGGFLVREIASDSKNTITIVTRNRSKKILFKDLTNVNFVEDVNEIKNEELYIINLAYGLDISFK